MKLKLKEIKKIEFTKGSVDITDPCYNRDVWCRLNNLPIRKGSYMCHNYVNKEGRTFMMEIFNADYFLVLNPATKIDDLYQEIGTVGVDAGMCGIFEEKPDYDDEEWSMWCGYNENVSPQHGTMLVNGLTFKCTGVCCCSGYGDGEYLVSGIKDHDKYVAIKIDFQ